MTSKSILDSTVEKLREINIDKTSLKEAFNKKLFPKRSTTNGKYAPYRSYGEHRIAEFLKQLGIEFKYEQEAEVVDIYNKRRIWYPDFYLTKHNIYLEFYGITGDADYEEETQYKTQSYSKSNIDVIEVYPAQLQRTIFFKHIISEVERILKKRPLVHKNATTRM